VRFQIIESRNDYIIVRFRKLNLFGNRSSEESCDYTCSLRVASIYQKSIQVLDNEQINKRVNSWCDDITKLMITH